MNVVWRQSDSYLKLDSGITQTPLRTTKRPHVGVSIGVVGIITENFDKQLLGSRLVLFRSQTPTVQDIAHQHVCNSVFGIDRTRVPLERLLKEFESLMPVCSVMRPT